MTDQVSNLDIPVAGGKYMAKVRLYLPPDFSENKKYPLMINVYGGPNSQQVKWCFICETELYDVCLSEVMSNVYLSMMIM